MARPPIRLEWISLLYLALFVLAVLSPSLVTHGVGGFSEVHVEEFFIFIFGITGLATFLIYERIVETKDQEHKDAVTVLDRTKRELVSSYEYIGAINRRIEALKKLANESVSSLDEQDVHRKELFRSIAASAATLVRTQYGVIRIVALNKLRTIKEFSIDSSISVKIANKDLLETHLRDRSHAFIRDENGMDVLVVPSSRKDMEAKAFLLLPLTNSESPEIDPEMLRVYANQAEVLYRVLAKGQQEPSMEFQNGG
jgi:hypothetical protein